MTTQPISIFICAHCPDKVWRDIGPAQGHVIRHPSHVVREYSAVPVTPERPDITLPGVIR